jgi:hypothetical protein
MSLDSVVKEAENLLKDFYESKPERDAQHEALMLKVDAAIKQYQEAIELALLCAQDIVDGWPTLTFRTIGQMTKKVDTLKQALEAVKK